MVTDENARARAANRRGSVLRFLARVFSPVIDQRHIFGVDGLEEIDVEFVERNHPHWMFRNADIRIGA